MSTLDIKVEGVSGYSTVKEFEDDTVRLQLGGNTSSTNPQRVASIELRQHHVNIIGGPELFDKIMANGKQDGEWSAPLLFAIGFKIMIDHFSANPHALMSVMTSIGEQAFEDGVQAARKKMRAALGICDTNEGYCASVEWEIQTEI